MIFVELRTVTHVLVTTHIHFVSRAGETHPFVCWCPCNERNAPGMVPERSGGGGYTRCFHTWLILLRFERATYKIWFADHGRNPETRMNTRVLTVSLNSMNIFMFVLIWEVIRGCLSHPVYRSLAYRCCGTCHTLVHYVHSKRTIRVRASLSSCCLCQYSGLHRETLCP